MERKSLSSLSISDWESMLIVMLASASIFEFVVSDACAGEHDAVGCEAAA